MYGKRKKTYRYRSGMQNDTPLISTEPLANLRTHDFEWSCDKLREIFKREREREREREIEREREREIETQ